MIKFKSNAVAIISIFILLVLVGCKSSSIDTQSEIQGNQGKQNEVTKSANGSNNITKEQENEYELKKGTLKTDTISSNAIAENQIKEKKEHKLYIYLPPSYNESKKKYPVIYFLHGFGDSALGFINYTQSELDQEFSKEPTKEFILVAVDGSNSVGGSFYVNSPIIGKWDDYTSKEVVTYIDSNYRTLAKSDSRGICGFSMGGFGALNLAFLHPDIYGAVFSMSPGVLAPGKIGDALDSWASDNTFLKSYSLAFAYDKDYPYLKIPKRDSSKKDNELLKQWESGFGDWDKKINAYQKLNKPLLAIGLLYGEADSYKWISEGTEYLSDLLDKQGIKHSLSTNHNGHSIPMKVMSDYIIPFFGQHLKWE